MWMIGGLIGLVIGAALGGTTAMLGAFVGAACGAWLGNNLGKTLDTNHSRLKTRLDWVEDELARLSSDMEALQRGKSVGATVIDTTPLPTESETQAVAEVESTPVAPLEIAPQTAPAHSDAPKPSPFLPTAARPIEVPAWLSRFWTGNPLVKIGIVLLFFGVASGLRLAAEYGLLPVPVRLFLAAAAAVGLIGFGFAKARAATHRVFGLSLQGGGFALLYLVTYFMLERYALIGPGIAFPTFGLLGVVCVSLAARQDGPALAILGLSGAFLAPILAGGNADSPLALFGYLALLNAFILAVDWFRAWRMLNIAGFVFTLSIGMAWGIDLYEERHYLVTQAFLVLFLVVYSGMPVLTALLRAPGIEGWRDGTLIFGAPVVGSLLQARLVVNLPYGMAWSALIASVWYALLWLFLRRNNHPQNDILERSHLGLALAFFTLSIPLAFGAQLTSALWSAEGCAVLWYGIQTRRLLPQAIGLLLQAAAGSALLVGWNELGRDIPVANDVVLSGTLLVTAGIASACMLRRNAASQPWVAPLLPFVWAMLWWLGIGLGEIGRFAPGNLHAPFGLLYLTATALLIEAFAVGFAWPQIRAGALLLLAALGIAPLVAMERSGHPMDGPMLLAFPVALGVHYALLRRHERCGAIAHEALRDVAAYWIAILALAAEIAWRLRGWTPGIWLADYTAWGMVLAAAVAIPVVGSRRGVWPFARPGAAYLPWAALLPFGALALLLPNAALRLSGDGSGVAYLPIFNVFDIVHLIGIASMLALTRTFDAANERQSRILVGAIAFLWLSTLPARIAFFWGGVPFEFSAMMRSLLFQMLLTLFWTVISIGAMIRASRQGRRKFWFGGFALLGVVGAKLLLFDASGRGTLMWTGTLIGVAVLVLTASYFAPLPPREGDTPTDGGQPPSDPDALDVSRPDAACRE